MSQTVCITGVSGFIGRHVAAEALRRGYRVTGVDRNPSSTDGIELVRADIRDRARVAQALTDNEYVIHLAAVTSNVEFIAHPVECYDINVNGFLNVIDTAAKSGCQKLVYASSAAVYLNSFSEEAVIDVRKQDNHYAKTKLMNEMMARSYEALSPMRAIGLRYFNVYGPGENKKGNYASIITILLSARKRGEPLVLYGDGKQARDLINVVDAARVTLDLLEKGTHEIYNVGTGLATPYVRIAAMIDERRISYVPNPLPSYQHYTRAEMVRLREALGEYSFMRVEDGVKDLQASL